MAPTNEVTARTFCEVFLAVYVKVHARFIDDTRWLEMFTTKAWNAVTLW
jgi:hypothetical protein